MFLPVYVCMEGQVEESQNKFREGTFFFAVVESGVGKHHKNSVKLFQAIGTVSAD